MTLIAFICDAAQNHINRTKNKNEADPKFVNWDYFEKVDYINSLSQYEFAEQLDAYLDVGLPTGGAR